MILRWVFTVVVGVFASQFAWADIDVIAGIGGTSYDYDATSSSTTNTDSLGLSGSTTIRLGAAMNVNDWFKPEGLYVEYGRATAGYYFGTSGGTTEVFEYEMRPRGLVL